MLLKWPGADEFGLYILIQYSDLIWQLIIHACLPYPHKNMTRNVKKLERMCFNCSDFFIF